MIVQHLAPRRVGRTAGAITTELNRWIAWFQAHPRQEFGDDPAPVFQLGDELGELCHIFDALQAHFEQGRTDPDGIYHYWSARDMLYQAFEYVVDVGTRDYGSMDQTRRMLQLLITCRERLSSLAEAANLAIQSETLYTLWT